MPEKMEIGYPDKPVVGLKYRVNEDEVIIPSYVRPSEAPDSLYGCRTATFVPGGTIQPTGWYVEFRYPGGDPQDNDYRRFIPFPVL